MEPFMGPHSSEGLVLVCFEKSDSGSSWGFILHYRHAQVQRQPLPNLSCF